MNAASLLSTYCGAALGLFAAFVLIHFLLRQLERGRLELRFDHLHRLALALVTLALILPAAAHLLPRQTLLRPQVQIWSGSVRHPSNTSVYVSTSDTPPVSAGLARVEPHGWPVPKTFSAFALGALFTALGLSLARTFLRRQKLSHLLRTLPVIRSVGRVRLVATSEWTSPFSARLGATAYVALPTELLTRPKDLKIAVQHELQHHRSGDTRTAHWLELLQAVFLWNPLVRALARQLERLQEFACDEFLIGQRNLCPRAYGRCLVRTAETLGSSRLIWAGTTRMTGGSRPSELRRRIEMLFHPTHHRKKSLQVVLIFAAGAIVFMASLAYASRSFVQDRRLTEELARKFVDKTNLDSKIPLDLNELVLEKLNRYVGTPDGRAWVKEAFSRLPTYREMIEAKIQKQKVPAELIAIAMYESGFRNDVRSPFPYRAAGLWQFIPQTARRYGLVVNKKRDDRTDPTKATDAAIWLFKDLYAEFKDWRLALKAYNEGSSRVRKLMDEYDTTDPWVLERASSRESYLSGAAAMIIIYKNPELLDL